MTELTLDATRYEDGRQIYCCRQGCEAVADTRIPRKATHWPNEGETLGWCEEHRKAPPPEVPVVVFDAEPGFHAGIVDENDQPSVVLICKWGMRCPPRLLRPSATPPMNMMDGMLGFAKMEQRLLQPLDPDQHRSFFPAGQLRAIYPPSAGDITAVFELFANLMGKQILAGAAAPCGACVGEAGPAGVALVPHTCHKAAAAAAAQQSRYPDGRQMYCCRGGCALAATKWPSESALGRCDFHHTLAIPPPQVTLDGTRFSALVEWAAGLPECEGEDCPKRSLFWCTRYPPGEADRIRYWCSKECCVKAGWDADEWDAPWFSSLRAALLEASS